MFDFDHVHLVSNSIKKQIPGVCPDNNKLSTVLYIHSMPYLMESHSGNDDQTNIDQDEFGL